MYCNYEDGIWADGHKGWEEAMTEELITNLADCKTEDEIEKKVETRVETAWQLTGIEFDIQDIAAMAIQRYCP